MKSFKEKLDDALVLQDELDNLCLDLFDKDMERYHKAYKARQTNQSIISNLETIVQAQKDLRYHKANLESELGEAGVFPKLDYKKVFHNAKKLLDM